MNWFTELEFTIFSKTSRVINWKNKKMTVINGNNKISRWELKTNKGSYFKSYRKSKVKNIILLETNKW